MGDHNRDTKREEDSGEPESTSTSTQRHHASTIKSLFYYVAIGAEVLLPLAFLISLKIHGETHRITWIIQGLMVIMVSGILLWIIIDLVLESLHG
jgi:hypothetical protein